jgi:MarR family 2-MHQ and catechol resistance regulon transcriptional repressor
MKSIAFGVDLEDRAQLMVAFPRLLIMAGEVTVKSGDKLIFEPFGLNVVKFSLLATLARGGSLSMTELKDRSRMMRSPSNFTQMVDDLERKKLVKRVALPEDRRVWIVEITAEGGEMVNRVMEQYHQIMEEYMRDFPTNEIREAVQAMIKWIWKTGEVAGIGHLKPTEEPFQE